VHHGPADMEGDNDPTPSRFARNPPPPLVESALDAIVFQRANVCIRRPRRRAPLAMECHAHPDCRIRAQNAFDAERRIDYRAKRRSAAPVAAAFVVAVVAAPLRRHSRFVGSTALVAAFVSLADCIIAILVAAEQSAQGLLPVGCL
jgi:hypothetical protein